MSNKIKMRTSKGTKCDICGCTKDQCLDLYDLMLDRTMFTLCDDCVDKLFYKTLSAICKTNKRTKTNKDLRVINKRARQRHLDYGRPISDLNNDK